jgi:predicted Zn-dependent protease
MRTVIRVGAILCLCLAPADTGASPAVESSRESVLLRAMQEELNRSLAGFKSKGDPAPYFLSYGVTEEHSVEISASYGAIKTSSNEKTRRLDVDVRVGDHRLDNSHRLRGDRFQFSFEYPNPVDLPIEDDPAAIKARLWLETDKRYKAAVERLIQVKANQAVMVKEEDESDDFSREDPARFVAPTVEIAPDIPRWERRLRDHSAFFKKFPEIYESAVSLIADATNKYLVNSEGTVLQHGGTHWRLWLTAQTKAEDGMDLYLYESFDVLSPEDLPDDRKVEEASERLARNLLALRNAPTIEPYTGPAILSGRAAAVFFHEIFGHRIEGHRQKDEEEGQTFTKKVGQPVLPSFVSVYDDPMQTRSGKIDLNGHYGFDDEGVPAQRVAVVEKGILKSFLMSRSPIAGFSKSNGHGRRSPGFRPVGRQGNLIVETTEPVTEERLREMLIEECRKQEKPYGLIFKDISGGFTFTGRAIPQAFQVTPLLVYRVYTDGRPDELVRGVDLIGTPLVSFGKILAAGRNTEVFNGYCGAESGAVPVSGVSPSILTGEIEIQKKEKSTERPPLLPPPTKPGKED